MPKRAVLKESKEPKSFRLKASEQPAAEQPEATTERTTSLGGVVASMNSLKEDMDRMREPPAEPQPQPQLKEPWLSLRLVRPQQLEQRQPQQQQREEPQRQAQQHHPQQQHPLSGPPGFPAFPQSQPPAFPRPAPFALPPPPSHYDPLSRTHRSYRETSAAIESPPAQTFVFHQFPVAGGAPREFGEARKLTCFNPGGTLRGDRLFLAMDKTYSNAFNEVVLGSAVVVRQGRQQVVELVRTDDVIKMGLRYETTGPISSLRLSDDEQLELIRGPNPAKLLFMDGFKEGLVLGFLQEETSLYHFFLMNQDCSGERAKLLIAFEPDTASRWSLHPDGTLLRARWSFDAKERRYRCQLCTYDFLGANRREATKFYEPIYYPLDYEDTCNITCVSERRLEAVRVNKQGQFVLLTTLLDAKFTGHPVAVLSLRVVDPPANTSTVVRLLDHGCSFTNRSIFVGMKLDAMGRVMIYRTCFKDGGTFTVVDLKAPEFCETFRVSNVFQQGAQRNSKFIKGLHLLEGSNELVVCYSNNHRIVWRMLEGEYDPMGRYHQPEKATVAPATEEKPTLAPATP
jgi:hypothetical protein